MSFSLVTIFGPEIKVYSTALIVDRQYTGFPGANGLTAMWLGTRGRHVIITGRLRGTGSTYALARAAVAAGIANIETWLNWGADTYTFFYEVYYNLILEKFDIVPDGQGKAFHLNANGSVTVDFVVTGRQLI